MKYFYPHLYVYICKYAKYKYRETEEDEEGIREGERERKGGGWERN